MPQADTYQDENQLALSLLCITALILSAVYYAKIVTLNQYLDKDAAKNATNTTEENAMETEKQKELNKVNLTAKLPPSCPKPDKSQELSLLCSEYLFWRLSCVPEDITNLAKHKIPRFYFKNKKYSAKNNSNETQTTIVNCIIAALLLTSLGAALLELYRAKVAPTTNNGKKGTKTPPNRKCSLADLTVLKHHRKELVRRESVLEQHCEEEGEFNQHHGSKPAPLHRRCSFPASLPSSSGDGAVAGYQSRRLSRKLSMAGDLSRRVSLVNESRRLSMVVDDETWSRRGSFVGEDSSPDRRHHTRLVHRH